MQAALLLLMIKNKLATIILKLLLNLARKASGFNFLNNFGKLHSMIFVC